MTKELTRTIGAKLPDNALRRPRILFLADGLLVRDIGQSSASQVLEAINDLAAAR